MRKAQSEAALAQTLSVDPLVPWLLPVFAVALSQLLV